MDSLYIGFFHDSTRRGHQCTLRGLEDAYRRSKSTVGFFSADARDDAPPPSTILRLKDDLSPFDAISLDLEFAGHPVLCNALFLLDSATDMTALPWRGGELDRIACLERVGAVDLRPWAFFRTAFNRDIPLLPAPLTPHRAASLSTARRVILICNDAAVAKSAGPEIRQAISAAAPEFEVIEVANTLRRPIAQSEWLEANPSHAAAHVHIGAPPDAISVGRLVDSMNMRVPCVVFDHTGSRYDADVSLQWRRPNYIHDVNIVWVSDITTFAETARAVLKDRTWAQSLTRNGLREVAIFHEQIQNSLLPTNFVENYLVEP
ncbi:MAG: hypothetical protein ACLPN5_04850 [Roseiarcus sp.]